VPGAVADALRARAASQGEVRLIVQLAAPGDSFADLPAAARQSREQQIANLQASLASRALQPGMRELVRFRTIPFMVFSANANAVDRLANLPEVLSMKEDSLEYPTLASSIPIIGADSAWTAGYDGTGQTIAVLDTGIDTSHPYFPSAKLVAEACFSSNGSGNSQSLCPGQAGSSTAPGSGQNCALPNCAHGTHVAGIALGNNQAGQNFGVAKGARLIAIQVFSCISGDCSSFGSIGSYESDQIRALEHVLALSETHTIAAVNMSLGSSATFTSQATCDDDNAARKEVIENLRAVGIATIIASGNSSSRAGLSQPGCISNAISVGNTTDADAISDRSNVASFLDLLAPGTDIISAAPDGGQVSNTGTSMSAPHVAGAWAVLRDFAPQAGINEILQALYQTGTSVDDQRPGGTVTDMRRINLDLALAVLDTPEPVIETSPVPGSLLDLGDVAVTAMGTQFNLEVTNAGDAELTLSCDINGLQESHFVVIACPSAVPASASTDVSLRCDPQTIGEFSATFTISSNDASNPTVNYTLQCTGLGVEIATFPVAGSNLAFGNVLVNTNSAELSVQVSNSGNQALSLGCGLAGTDMDSFAITACPGAVANGAQALVKVRCEPDSQSDLSASLQVTSNDPDESLLSFPLGCTGVAPVIDPDLPADSLLDFGSVYVDESSVPLSINIGNSGSADLNISCAVQGSHNASYQLVQCPASIPPAQSAPVQVQCTPNRVGTRLAELRINSNDASAAELLFRLTCLAELPPGTIFMDDFETD